MSTNARIVAAIAYVPLLGWLLAPLLGRGNAFTRFHLRQSVGLIGFLLVVGLGWALVSFVVSLLIPYGFLIANALFSLVIAVLIFTVVVWVGGLLNAVRGRVALLPSFGATANRLPL